MRTLLITPFLIMPVVAGLIWKNQMLNGLYGVVNWVLERFGVDSIEFVSRYPRASIIAVLVWQWTPFMMLIMLAGLQSQPSEVLEAAEGGRGHRRSARSASSPCPTCARTWNSARCSARCT